jgi:predicted transposase/invertase (TIGR01784 family)
MSAMPHPAFMNDVVFKIVFGTEKNEALLRALVNALLGLTGPDRIAELRILNPHAGKDHPDDRGVILDVKARDGHGRLYNVEVQVAEQPAYIQRSLYYAARLFSEQLGKGDPYIQIARTVAISLLDFNLFPEIADLHSRYRFYDVEHGRELSDVLELHYIELPKFNRDKPQELRTPFEKWLHVLKFGDFYEAGGEELPETLKKEEGIAMAVNEMRRAYADSEVRELIEARRKAEHDEATRMAWAIQQGKLEGKLEGMRKAVRHRRATSAANFSAWAA